MKGICLLFIVFVIGVVGCLLLSSCGKGNTGGGKEVEKGGTGDVIEGWVLKRHESPMRNSMVEWTSKIMNIHVCFHIHLLCSHAVDYPPTPKSWLKWVLLTNTLCEWVSSGNCGRDELMSSLKEPQNSGGFITEQEKPGRRGDHEWQGSGYVLSGASDPQDVDLGGSSQSFSVGRQVQTGLWKTGIALLSVNVVFLSLIRHETLWGQDIYLDLPDFPISTYIHDKYLLVKWMNI